MFPVLAAIGPFTVSSLGFFIAVAFFFGSFHIWKKAREEHFDDGDIFDAIFLSFFGGIIGGRLFHILMNFEEFGYDFGRWINLAYSNQFSWIGFLFGAMVMLRIVCKKKKWDFFEFADLSVWGVVLAQIFVRVGQFLDGSYVGLATNFITGLSFPGLEGRRHPLSLYEIPILLLTYFILKWLDKHYRLFGWYQTARGEAKTGFLWQTYLLSVIFTQLILDFVFQRQTVFFIFSLRQIFLTVLLILALFVFWLRAGNDINLAKIRIAIFGKDKTEMEPIRPAVQPLISRQRPRRFSRAKTGQDALAK